MSSHFNTLVRNPEVFRHMLDGLFKDWPISYDVLTADTKEYVLHPFNKERQMLSLCRFIQAHQEGLEVCRNCHRENAEIAFKSQKPHAFCCHAGAQEIAIPILVDQELVATILCGQGRFEDPLQEYAAQNMTARIESQLRIPENKLQLFRNSLPVLGQNDIAFITDEIQKLVTYVLTVEQERMDLRRQLGETKQIRDAMHELTGVIDDLDDFWEKMSVVISKLITILEGKSALILMYEAKSNGDKTRPTVKAIANLPKELLHRTYEENDKEFSPVLRDRKPIIISYPTLPRPGTVCSDIRKFPAIQQQVDHIALIPIRLDSRYDGVMIFFFSKQKDNSESLSLDKKLDLLVPITDRIATAYQNCRLHSGRKAQTKSQRDWLTNVSHQLLAPITGIQGHAENLSTWLSPWTSEAINEIESNPESHITVETKSKQLKRISNTIDSIMWMTFWVTRLARNFAWMADTDENNYLIGREVISNLVAFLIGCARNVQGVAKEKGIRRVHVDVDSVRQLDGKVSFNRELFTQAIGNILDNAVKYSDKQTDVTITASQEDEWGIIYITNRGIPIRKNEIEEIFHRDIRTRVARARYPIGSGLGLPIARSIVELHGGWIKVEASKLIQEPDYKGYETTFEVGLKLLRGLDP